ncbi:MAG: hypothetical protein Kow006_13410 [Gammaproteobacteria bacterium]
MSRCYVRTEAEELVVEAEAVRIGSDLLVYLWGGDRPHIGAVAAAQPRPSLADGSRTSATASVLTYLGHKEDEVVKYVSERLASELDTNVVATAGIHWDELPGSAIRTIIERCREVCEKLIDQLLPCEEEAP